jgi:hypothetical protein
MRRFAATSLILLFTIPSVSQPLILKRGKKAYSPEFNVGEEIRIKLVNERKHRKMKITGFYSDAIDFYGTKIKLTDIESVQVEFTHGFFSPSNGKKLVIAGLAYFMVDQFNNSIVQGNEARISEQVVITSTALVAFGSLWMMLRNKTIKLGRKNRLMIIDPYNEGNLLD